jgi:hypothetical protein
MYLDIKRLQQCNAIPMYTTGLENLLKNTKKKRQENSETVCNKPGKIILLHTQPYFNALNTVHKFFSLFK